MNDFEKKLISIRSISIYRNILNDDTVKCFIKLLNSTKSDIELFFDAWGEFFFSLCNKGYSHDFSSYILKLILEDDNYFSKSVAKGEQSAINSHVLYAVENDFENLIFLANITPDYIIENYIDSEKLNLIVDMLPLWGNEEYSTSNINIEYVIDFHNVYGYKMFANYKAFIVKDSVITPVINTDEIKLCDLKEYEYERNIVLENTYAFLNGETANNCLLYGDKGTGKSSTVKAILNEYYNKGLRVIEVPKNEIINFSNIIAEIADLKMKFIIFIDDLSFQKQDDIYVALKAILEGSLVSKPKNVLIYATSNRRHLVKENFSDRAGDDIHRNDTMQESLSLADRFGLTVNFSVPSKETYLNIVLELACQNGVKLNAEELKIKAERFALSKGGRSPRRAKQFINSIKYSG